MIALLNFIEEAPCRYINVRMVLGAFETYFDEDATFDQNLCRRNFKRCS